MKKVFVSLVVLMFAMSAFATDGPIDKGSMILGGDVSFKMQSGDAYENSDGDALNTLTLMPNLGYFVSPSIMIGAMVNFEKISQGDNSLTELDFGPQVGYFFNMDPERTDVKGSIYPFLKAFFMFDKLSDDGDLDVSKTIIGGQGGVMFMLSNAVALDFGVLFSSDSWKPDGADESTTGTTIEVGAGISAFCY